MIIKKLKEPGKMFHPMQRHMRWFKWSHNGGHNLGVTPVGEMGGALDWLQRGKKE